mmetsp:Transcript_21479/g.47038  ORF Transcript_21479/g.47038 Transcript_21479/m.47038 type:complete len:310 (-) Transcript_21479:198-1127(-)
MGFLLTSVRLQTSCVRCVSPVDHLVYCSSVLRSSQRQLVVTNVFKGPSASGPRKRGLSVSTFQTHQLMQPKHETNESTCAKAILLSYKEEAIILAESELGLGQQAAQELFDRLQVLLPDMDEPLMAVAITEVDLSTVDTILSSLTWGGLERQRQEVVSILQGLCHRAASEQLSELQACEAVRESAVRLFDQAYNYMGSLSSYWLFEARQPLQLQVVRLKAANRSRMVRALVEQMRACMSGSDMARRLVLLRHIFRGNMSSLVVRQPPLLAVDVDVISAVAAQAQERGVLPEAEALQLIQQEVHRRQTVQ